MFILLSCGSNEQKVERMAKKYCSSCHEFTAPELLDKKTWEKSVLPEMAVRMGLPTDLFNLNVSSEDLPIVLSTIPEKPMVSEEEYKAIVNYFLTHAPDSLIPGQASPPGSLTQFEVQRISISDKLPMITTISVDYPGKLMAGTRDNKIYLMKSDFTVTDTIHVSSPPSHIKRKNEVLEILLMGVMDPNDQRKGSLIEYSQGSNTQRTLIDSLKRPVFFGKSDFNNDGKIDYVVCEFGNYTGRLTIVDGDTTQKERSYVIDPFPGARKVEIRDVNNDNKPDILALMTQGNERISLFLNQGNFRFQSQSLLRFPAVYGSSYFEIHDFNQDGHFDILYTNGDNSDYSAILKPYHGVRIFTNDGSLNFKETWFYPLNGASWASANDYDKDGDVDIATISFFPDFKRSPENGFVYFENSNNKYVPYTTPESKYGRWIVMDSGDVDQDGDLDIVLGALDFQPELLGDFDQWRNSPASFLFLKNKNIE
jgi:hypothetical protein